MARHRITATESPQAPDGLPAAVHIGAPGGDNRDMSDPMLHIVLNGEPRAVPAPLDIPGLLEHEGLAQRRVAVEVNGDIVPRSRHAGHPLNDGDRVEIVHALGGG